MIPVLRRTPRENWLSPFDALRRGFDPIGPWDEAQAQTATGIYPVDVREDNDNLYVEAEMPGFTRDQIDVNLENGVLSIRAERTPEDFSGTRHLDERRFTRVQRSFTLPTSVDENKINASFADGLLKLTLPKNVESKSRKIEVK